MCTRLLGELRGGEHLPLQNVGSRYAPNTGSGRATFGVRAERRSQCRRTPRSASMIVCANFD
eukprot:5901737-Prymnesium_polylepis.1